MPVPIIAALRTQSQLHQSLLHTAQELAHRASIYGVVRVAYRYLPQKCHSSLRTVIRHINKLIDLGIIRKTPVRTPRNKVEMNTYTFTIAWNKSPLHKRAGDKVATNLPQTEREGKNTSLAADIKHWEKALSFCQHGTDAYVTTLERLEKLKTLEHASIALYPKGDFVPVAN